MFTGIRWGVIISLLALPSLYAQAPVVVDGGVINAASFAKGQVVAPGSLVSIFGTNLAPSTSLASAIPLPISLAGVSVTFNGIIAPLVFVSPGQINAQLPWGVLSGVTTGTATVVVATPSGTSVSKTFSVGPFSPGIFSISFGIGQAIAINLDGTLAAPVGSVPLLTTHPAKPGDTVIILGTGLGAVTPAIADGTSPKFTDGVLHGTNTTPTVLFGGQAATTVWFSGLSPEFVGVNQLNVMIPANAPAGNAVSLQLSEGGITSTAAVTIAIAGGTITPPSVPTNLTATAASSSQINLAWSPSTGTVSGYTIYRNGAKIGTSSTASFSDNGLTASTAYTYTVSAFDPGGTNSAQSTSASATTLGSTPPPPVPSQYQDLYSQLKDDLDKFNATLDSSWSGAKYPVSFATDLYIADNAANGKILQAGYYSQFMTPFLNAIQSLNIKAVKLTISFPILYQPYYASASGANNAAQYQQTLNFYLQLAADVRARGLKFVVVSQAVHPSDSPSIASYYKTLSSTTYIAGRSQLLQTLEQQLKPDYLILQAEPQTEEDDLASSIPSVSTIIHTASGDAGMLGGFIRDLNSSGLHTGVIVGTGMGTWQHDFSSFQSAIPAIPGLDLVDIHVYPVNDINSTDYLQRILTLSDAARAAGKKVGMSEAWLYKERDSELTQGFTSTSIYSRDVFSFWAPLDQEFLLAMYKSANFKQFDYMSPFFDKYFFAYLDYNQIPTTATATDLGNMANAALATALSNHSITSTGIYYQNLIK